VTSIYVLMDPVTAEVRYVGKTVRPVARRLDAHCSDARCGVETHLARWIRQLGARPAVMVVEQCGADWADREAWWIAVYQAAGAPLCNLTSGGEGAPGVVHTIEARRRMSDAQRSRMRTPAEVERLRMLGRRTGSLPKSPEHREKAAEARRGRPLSAEHRAKLAAAQHRRRDAETPDERAMFAAKMVEVRRVAR
jgi:hypothetical protein